VVAEVADPAVVAVHPEDHVVTDDGACDHLGDDERVDVGADLAALDAPAQHRLDDHSAWDEQPGAEDLEEPGLAPLLDQERAEDAERPRLDQEVDRRPDEDLQGLSRGEVERRSKGVASTIDAMTRSFLEG
jgi:hypothetical protein